VAAAELRAAAACSNSGNFAVPCESFDPAPWGATCPGAVAAAAELSSGTASAPVDDVAAGSATGAVAGAAAVVGSSGDVAFVVAAVEPSGEVLAPRTSAVKFHPIFSDFRQ
jgi:hypothetical protein